MSRIKLLYSYLYIENTKNLQVLNNKIYDSKNNFICGLLNIPKKIEENEFRIIIEKILVKNKQSKKIVNTFYEKNNIKIFIEFDTKTQNFIKYKNFFLKLLKRNNLTFLDINQKLFDFLCLNKNYKRNLFSNLELNLYNQNIIKIFNLYIDLQNNSIKNKIKIEDTKIVLNFNIIYSDYILGTINIINEYKLNNLLVLCNNSSMKELWNKNIKNNNSAVYIFSELKNNTNLNYENIIVCDLNIKEIKTIKNIKNANLVCIYSSCEKETIKDFLEKFYELSNITNKVEKNYDITLQTLYNFCKCILHHSFYDKMVLSNNIIKKKINTYQNINPVLLYIKFNIKKKIDKNVLNEITKCSICLEEKTENDFVYLNCGHKFCKDCSFKLKHLDYNCSICRRNITQFYKNVQYDDLLKRNNWYYLGINIVRFIELVKRSKNVVYIYIEKIEIVNLLNNILNYVLKKKYQFIFNPKIALNIFRNETNVDIYYIKTNTNMKYSSSTITMFLKNYYKKINIFEIII